ncbi:MAG: mechanosensitive ion channel family protein [Bryobacterales bacterium]|nr:mechanosensitive ion channel family protein [Bryobacterales bacterium]
MSHFDMYRFRSNLRRLALSLFLVVYPASAQNAPAGSPVLLGDTELFRLYERIGSFSLDERAKAVSSRIEAVAQDFTIPVNAIVVADNEVSSDIVVGERILLSATDRDAQVTGQSRPDLARLRAEIIRTSIERYRREHSREKLTRGAAIAAAATLLLLLGCWIAFKALRRLASALRSLLGTSGAAVFLLRVLGAERASRVRRLAFRATMLVAFGGLLHLYLLAVAAQFPGTRRLEAVLLDYGSRPVLALLSQLIAQLPNLAYVAVIAILAIGANKALHLFFQSIEKEEIHISGFYPDWAEPTYKLTALLVVIAAAIIAFPYIPGSSSPAFQGVSLLAGVLFSIGSSSLVANAFAGVVLIYMRSFRTGDRVKIADTMGDVEEKTLLVTRIRTVKNEHITIANSMILGNHVINFSKAAQEDGLILYTSVTIGYDAPWRIVHELLLGAAVRTEYVSTAPEPFVLQTNLHDSYVEYQINVYTKFPRKMTSIYSQLRANIQDSFNEGGVEILSPAYHAVRDGNHNTIPKPHLPADYEAPAFKVQTIRRAQLGQSAGAD